MRTHPKKSYSQLSSREKILLRKKSPFDPCYSTTSKILLPVPHREKNLTQKTKLGFTIVELMFAMTFVSTLLIAIAVVTINIVSIYQKGLALKSVNSVGRSLIEEFTTTINASPAVDTTSLCNHLATNNDGASIGGYASVAACTTDRAYKYVFGTRTNDKSQQLGGVFCTGKYSYLWNTKYGIDNDATLKLIYRNNSDAIITYPDPTDPAAKPFRLIRINDATHRACTAFLEAGGPTAIGNIELNITNEVKNGAINKISDPTTGYLNAFDLDLLLYELTIQPISQDEITLRTFMAGNFILATDRGIDIIASGDYCQNTYKEGDTVFNSTSSLNNLGAEFNYCAINKFNFAARTAGR